MRRAFTLIELMISISILAIIMIFLYKSYATMNRSNRFYKQKLQLIKDEEIKKKILYIDFLTSFGNSIKILNQEPNSDVVFLQTKNSMHKRYNPYVAYIFKNHKLYRLESLKKFTTYPLVQNSVFSFEVLGDCEIFRVYKSKKTKTNSYLIDAKFKNTQEIILKINPLD